MKQIRRNMGYNDRLRRCYFSAVFAVLYISNTIYGKYADWAILPAIYLFLTSALAYSPLYVLFKHSTKRKKEFWED